MSQIAKNDRELNELILGGQALEGLERFYAEEVAMQENTEPPTVGKDANRKRETEFFDSVAELHEASVKSTGVGDDVTFSEWVFDVTFKDGQRKRLEQTAVRHWKDGQIVRERFYYNPS